jgi:hypothetical protein
MATEADFMLVTHFLFHTLRLFEEKKCREAQLKAVERATQFLNGRVVEVWDHSRRVVRLDRQTNSASANAGERGEQYSPFRHTHFNLPTYNERTVLSVHAQMACCFATPKYCVV